MFLIIEVILTVVAWNRGWKAWALLPGGLGFTFAFILGAILGGGNTTPNEIMTIGIVFDIIVIIILALMTIFQPKKSIKIL